MENKNYLLVARSGDGYIHEKVAVKCDLDAAKLMVKMIMSSSPRLVRGEIIDGNRTHVGDFSVKPCVYVRRDKEDNFTEETR